MTVTCIYVFSSPVEGLSYKPKYQANIFYSLLLFYFCFLLYSLPLGSAYCLSISLKRILLIQVYTRSGTLHWSVVVACLINFFFCLFVFFVEGSLEYLEFPLLKFNFFQYSSYLKYSRVKSHEILMSGTSSRNRHISEKAILRSIAIF